MRSPEVATRRLCAPPREVRNGCIGGSTGEPSSAMKRLPIEGDASYRSFVRGHESGRQRRIDEGWAATLSVVNGPPQEVDQRQRLLLRHRCTDRVQLLVDEEVREARDRVAGRARGVKNRDVAPIAGRGWRIRERRGRCSAAGQAREDPS